MKTLFFIFMCTLSFVFAVTTDEAILEVYDSSGERWGEFKNELAWYLEKTKPSLESYHGEDKEENQYFFEKEMTSYKLFVEAMNELQEEFRRFRDKMEEVRSLLIDGKCAYVTQAYTSLDVTNWYTNYLEEHLFGKGWKEEYKKYCDLQKSP